MAWYDDLRATQQSRATAIRDATVKANNYAADAAIAQQNQTSDRAQVDNYAGYMKNARNFGQQMAATGQNGGGSETGYLALLNDYGGNRFNTEAERGANNSATNLERMKENNSAYTTWQEAMGAADDAYYQNYANDLAQQEAAAAAARASSGSRNSASSAAAADTEGASAYTIAQRIMNQNENYTGNMRTYLIQKLADFGYGSKAIEYALNQLKLK